MDEQRQDDQLKPIQQLCNDQLKPIQQLCADTECSLEDLPEAMDDREGWR